MNVCIMKVYKSCMLVLMKSVGAGVEKTSMLATSLYEGDFYVQETVFPRDLLRVPIP